MEETNNQQKLKPILQELIKQQEQLLAQQQAMLEQFQQLQRVLLGESLEEDDEQEAQEPAPNPNTPQEENPNLEEHQANTQKEEEFITLFSVAPKNGFFFGRQLSEHFIARQHIYRIEIVDEERAFYYLVEDAATRQHAFNIPDNYILPAIEIDGIGRLSEASEITLEKGTLKKVGNNWQIVDKAILIMNK